MAQISTKLARQLVLNFKNNKVNRTYSINDTKGVWFDRLELEQALNTPVGGVIPTGIRFYFAAYESMMTGRPPKHGHKANKVTLVIIPTRGTDSSGQVVTFPSTGEVIHFDLLEDPNALPGYDSADFKEFNDGQICPPPPLNEEGLYKNL